MHKHFDRIKKYHSDISEKKLNTYSRLFDIYEKINVKINLISRKDFENFYLHHILHSLSIIKFNLIPEKNLKIIDLGTGGGIPGIPLAIFYEHNKFFLVDSIRKKIKSVNTIIKELELGNVKTFNDRIENLEFNADIIICRSVSSIKISKNVVPNYIHFHFFNVNCQFYWVPCYFWQVIFLLLF